MEIKIIDIQSGDEDFGAYLQFEIPEVKFKGFIDISEWYSQSFDNYDECFFMNKYHDELIGLVEKWINDNELTSFRIGTYPTWDKLPECVADYIYYKRFEMGFINPQDWFDSQDQAQFYELCDGFTSTLLNYPALSDVISLDETQVSIMRNGDAVITFGSAACYVNWYGYEV